MEHNKSKIKPYAYLPEDLLLEILKKTPETAEKLSQIIGANDNHVLTGIDILKSQGLILSLDDSQLASDSLIAVDGANIIEKMTSSDVMMAIAVGVEGLPKKNATHWPQGGEQYYQWQEALPHHVANARLCQGIMFLMELSILANSNHEFRIMDGSHITSILKINSLLSAKASQFADKEYVQALSKFLKENYNSLIPDIPDIIDNAFSSENIFGMVKYSSSREILNSILEKLDIPGDDKTYFSLALKGGEYTKPLPVGQSNKERGQWRDIHITCNLDLGLPEQDIKELNARLEQTLERFRPGGDEKKSQSQLYFCYYKPIDNGLCYRLEIKKSLAENQVQLPKLLASIREQVFFPEIQEPYPQFLADMIAKNISHGMDAVIHALRASEKLNNNKNFKLLMSYRSN